MVTATRAFAATRRFRPVLLATTVMFVVFAVTQPVFFAGDNLKNLLVSVAGLWLVSIGMTIVMISGGFDLSSGAIASLSGVFLAEMIQRGVPGAVAVLLTLLFGLLVGGVLNGVLIGPVGLSFFVVTLGTMIALTGVVSLWTNTETIFVNDQVLTALALHRFLGIPIPIWVMAIATAAGLVVLHRTVFGRDLYAVGGSPSAARLSGVRTARTTIAAFAISGGCAAAAGVLATGRVGASVPQVDQTLALNAAAAVLLGGTALIGGSGGLGGTVFGVLFIGIMQNGLSISGIPSFWQQVLTGTILILAVLGDRFDGITSRFRRRRSMPTTVGDRLRPAPETPVEVDAAIVTGAPKRIVE